MDHTNTYTKAPKEVSTPAESSAHYPPGFFLFLLCIYLLWMSFTASQCSGKSRTLHNALSFVIENHSLLSYCVHGDAGEN